MSNTVVLRPDEEPPIILTEKAIIAVKEVMDCEEIEGDGLRIFVCGGGCAGLQYGLDFDEVKENDFVIDFDGVTVYIDPLSAMHLEGTVIDYQTGLMGSGFKFNNPSAKRTCGCGSSFS